MLEELGQLKQEALAALERGEDIRDKYLGRRDGALVKILRGLKNLPLEERREVGKLANEIKKELEEKVGTEHCSVPTRNIDFSLPGKKQLEGHLHPLSRTQNEIAEIFAKMNFHIYEGPELENDYYNFEALNIPKDHPARDLQDTFFTTDGRLLRTHTSNMQVRIMEKIKPPLRIAVMGRCFRYEATDSRHEHTFYQLEGFVVDEKISLANLAAVIKDFLSVFFQREIKIRLRPGYFPFVEPGLEVDCSCLCQNGCSLCKNTGWLEIAGAGMIHPNVFRAAGYPVGKYTGFAFGFGLNRLCMLKYGIDDIRLFLSGSLQFLKQF